MFSRGKTTNGYGIVVDPEPEGVLYTDTVNVYSTDSGTSQQVLTSNGPLHAPTFQPVSGGGIVGVVPLKNGGTGVDNTNVNSFFAGPPLTSGSATFRKLNSDDFDTPLANAIGNKMTPSLQTYVDECTEKANEAKNSADSAAFSANSASNSASQANTSKNAAQTSASEAASSATAASTSATEAAASATTATEEATTAIAAGSEAATSATAAAASATEAAASAATATTEASTAIAAGAEAATSATAAATSATAAAGSATASAGSATASAGSATAAATSATNAAISATSAEGSAVTATTQANIAITQATNAAASATAASSSATAAAGSATAAETSAGAAATSAGEAATAAGTATTEASTAIAAGAEAATSATAAAGSATAAAGSASAAAISATAAGGSATAAAGSATAAATSATNAGISATSAQGSAVTATTQANIAITQATNAAASASAALASETAASGSAGAAATSATAASGSATAAAGSAGAAATSAGAAGASATAAGASATAADGSAIAAGVSAAAAGVSAAAAAGSASSASTSASNAQSYYNAISAAQNPNTVYSGPSSGSSTATPTFRALVSADIPNLDTGKLTSGTLAVARGGTSLSSITNGAALVSNGSGGLTAVTGTSGQVLTSNGTSAPSFTTLSGFISGLTTGYLVFAGSATSVSTPVNIQWTGTQLIMTINSQRALFNASTSVSGYGAGYLAGNSTSGGGHWVGIEGIGTVNNFAGQPFFWSANAGTDIFRFYNGTSPTLLATISSGGVATPGTLQGASLSLTNSIAPNVFYGGPVSGSGTPTFRTLVPADIPSSFVTQSSNFTSNRVLVATSSSNQADTPYQLYFANSNKTLIWNTAATESIFNVNSGASGASASAIMGNSVTGNSLTCALDGTGLLNLQPGKPVFFAYPSTSGYYWYNGNSYATAVLLASLSSTGTFTSSDIAITTSKTQNYVWAAPSASNGTPSFRALATVDLPSNAVRTTASFSTATFNFVPFANGTNSLFTPQKGTDVYQLGVRLLSGRPFCQFYTYNQAAFLEASNDEGKASVLGTTNGSTGFLVGLDGPGWINYQNNQPVLNTSSNLQTMYFSGGDGGPGATGTAQTKNFFLANVNGLSTGGAFFQYSQGTNSSIYVTGSAGSPSSVSYTSAYYTWAAMGSFVIIRLALEATYGSSSISNVIWVPGVQTTYNGQTLISGQNISLGSTLSSSAQISFSSQTGPYTLQYNAGVSGNNIFQFANSDGNATAFSSTGAGALKVNITFVLMSI